VRIRRLDWVYVYMYIHIYVYKCIHVYIYICIQEDGRDYTILFCIIDWADSVIR